MDSQDTTALHDQLHENTGAIDVLTLLLEEMEQWLEEAQDDSKREALENVVGHLEALEEEYKHRSTDLRRKLAQ